MSRKACYLLLVSLLLAAGTTAWLVRANQARKAAAKPAKQRSVPTELPPLEPINPVALRAQITALTGGARVKLVWVENPVPQGKDTFARTEELRLVGFDSQGADRHVIAEKLANYTRPLLTPDGTQVLYNANAATGTELHPQMHLVDWDGQNDRVLGPGFVVAVWLDPSTKVSWVYALEKLLPSSRAGLLGERLFRFPLTDPKTHEAIWDKTDLTTDNLQFSRDGQRFAAQFPWPEGGWADLATGSMHRMARGCWTSFAPDNSYLAWIFSGTHKRLKMHDTVSGKLWEVSLLDAPGLNGWQGYHPRWSNHPRFFTMSGPYPPRSKDPKQSLTRPGASYADIYLGKFSAKMDKVEAWARITANLYGDFYPDAWIQGAETAVLENFPQSAPLPPREEAPPWPATTDHLLYGWATGEALNQLPGRHMTCRSIAHGIGRFGRRQEMILDGGWFETEKGTTEALATALPAAAGLTLEFLLSETAAAAAPVRLIALVKADDTPYLEITRTASDVVCRLGSATASTPLAWQPGAPQHLVLRLNAEGLQWFANGVPSALVPMTPGPLAAMRDARLQFGSPAGVPTGWSARLQNIGLSDVAYEDAVVRQQENFRDLKPLAPLPQIKLRARCVAATEPDESQLASYQRMLVDHTYEVIAVLEGKLEAKKINVLHWAVLDRKRVPGIPRKQGQEFDLTVEAFADHPELGSELQQSESDDFTDPVYLDAVPPTLGK